MLLSIDIEECGKSSTTGFALNDSQSSGSQAAAKMSFLNICRPHRWNKSIRVKN